MSAKTLGMLICPRIQNPGGVKHNSPERVVLGYYVRLFQGQRHPILDIVALICYSVTTTFAGLCRS